MGKMGVCLHRTQRVVAPPLRVTLLKQHGINASEADLSNVCCGLSSFARHGAVEGCTADSEKTSAGEHDIGRIVASR